MRAKMGRAAAVAAVSGVAALVFAGYAHAATRVYPSKACPQSSTGLSSCIDGAKDGDTIQIKPGTYHELNTSVDHSVTLSGTCGTSVIDALSGGTHGDGLDIAANGVTVRCLTIQHAGSRYGINNSGGYAALTVDHVSIRDAYYAVYQGSGDKLTITNSSFVGLGAYGIYQAGSSTGDTITGTTMSNIYGSCMELGGMFGAKIENDTLGPCDGEGVYVDSGDGNTISGNKFQALESDCIDGYSADTTVTRNSFNGCDDTGIYFDAHGAVVTNNVFNGKIDGLTIELSCSDNAVVSGNSQLTGGTDDDDWIFVCGSNVKITGNTSAVFAYNGIDCNTCNNALVAGNKVTGGGEGTGVYVKGAHPTVTGNTVAGGWDGNGLYVSCSATCSGSSVNGNHESNCSDECAGYSISTSGCVAFPCMTIASNSATINVAEGFDIAASFSLVKGNTAVGNGFTSDGCDGGGFYFASGGSNQIVGNTAMNNACQGFDISEANDLLQGNSAGGNVAHGFEIESYAGNTLTGNKAAGNRGDGFNNDGTGTNFSGNTASGNRQDCTSDAGEGATLGTVTGNACADKSNFLVDSTLTDW